MKTIHYNHRGVADILALCLIPISGFATDIYLPSLPSMTTGLGASMGEVQLSIMIHGERRYRPAISVMPARLLWSFQA